MKTFFCLEAVIFCWPRFIFIWFCLIHNISSNGSDFCRGIKDIILKHTYSWYMHSITHFCRPKEGYQPPFHTNSMDSFRDKILIHHTRFFRCHSCASSATSKRERWWTCCGNTKAWLKLKLSAVKTPGDTWLGEVGDIWLTKVGESLVLAKVFRERGRFPARIPSASASGEGHLGLEVSYKDVVVTISLSASLYHADNKAGQEWHEDQDCHRQQGHQTSRPAPSSSVRSITCASAAVQYEYARYTSTVKVIIQLHYQCEMLTYSKLHTLGYLWAWVYSIHSASLAVVTPTDCPFLVGSQSLCNRTCFGDNYTFYLDPLISCWYRDCGHITWSDFSLFLLLLTLESNY